MSLTCYRCRRHPAHDLTRLNPADQPCGPASSLPLIDSCLILARKMNFVSPIMADPLALSVLLDLARVGIQKEANLDLAIGMPVSSLQISAHLTDRIP